MQGLLSDHADITDDRLDKLQAITGGLVESMVELWTNVVQLTVTVDKMATKVDRFAKNVDDLVEALLREPRNGKGSSKPYGICRSRIALHTFRSGSAACPCQGYSLRKASAGSP